MLYCPNYTCQTPNSETNRFCQKCRTPLPKHYLWAVGEGIETDQLGDLLANRYLYKGQHIFLDTKPGLVSSEPVDVPQAFVPYLRLSPYRLHVPQIYDLVANPATASGTPILLLDQASLQIPPNSVDGNQEPEPPSADQSEWVNIQTLPTLVESWQSASALRQLNWLWQIANLWQPFASERVVSTLLTSDCLRVEGQIIRVLQLKPDIAEAQPLLSDLGQQWMEWADSAHPIVKPALNQLSQYLLNEKIRSAEQLIEQLDNLLDKVGRSHARQIQIATLTDQGPSRQRNEDACFPSSGTVTTQIIPANQTTLPASEAALVIVCDGIGGHQGGNVASNLAIETVWRQLQTLPINSLTPAALIIELEKAACAANDVISDRNDSERRFDRQRMGTTLVIGLVRRHEIYITHVGDSRAYWITRQACRQVTQDDDVASREVRLGYSLYRDALQQPSAGSLVQALGMGASKMLHPTVQRFILDEDSIFLLCTDGLSDNDRVDESWDTDILPLLYGKSDLGVVSRRLVDIANSRNGHDNVTVGLLCIRVEASEPQAAIAASLSYKPSQELDTTIQPLDTLIQPEDIPTARPAPAESTLNRSANPSRLKTRVVNAKPQRQPNLLSLLLGIVLLSAMGGLLIYFLFPGLRTGFNPLVQQQPTPQTPVASTRPTISASPTPTPALPVAGSFVQVQSLSPQSNPTTDFALILKQQPPQSQPADPTSDRSADIAGIVADGSVIYIAKRTKVADELWVQLRVCSLPPATTPTTPPPNATEKILQPGETGWIQEAALISLVQINPLEPTPEEQNACIEITPPNSPTPQYNLPEVSLAQPSEKSFAF